MENFLYNLACNFINIFWNFFPSNIVPLNTVKHCTNSIQGHRGKMEDTDINYYFEETNDNLYGIFDGHGGDEVSIYLKNNFIEEILKDILWEKYIKTKEIKDLISIITNVSKRIDENLTEHVLVGSTSIVTIITESTIVCANVGDSRCILLDDNNNFEILSIDHKPDLENEAERIISAGGFLNKYRPIRVDGLLAVSRAFGDYMFKQKERYWKTHKVIAFPEIITIEREKRHKYVVLACDGIWDVLSSYKITNIINKFMNSYKSGFYPFLLFTNEFLFSSYSDKYQRVYPLNPDIYNRNMKFIEVNVKITDEIDPLKLLCEYITNIALNQGSEDNCTITIVEL